MKTSKPKKNRAFVVLQISGSRIGWYFEVRRTRRDALARMREIRKAGDDVLGPFECEAELVRHGTALLALLDEITYSVCERRTEVLGLVPARVAEPRFDEPARHHRHSGSSRGPANDKHPRQTRLKGKS